MREAVRSGTRVTGYIRQNPPVACVIPYTVNKLENCYTDLYIYLLVQYNKICIQYALTLNLIGI